MADILLKLTALTYRPMAIGWESDDGQAHCFERVESGILIARFVRLTGYAGGEVPVDLKLKGPNLILCGLTVTVVRPMAWGVRSVETDRRFLPKISFPSFRLCPTLILSFGVVDGWFVNA